MVRRLQTVKVPVSAEDKQSVTKVRKGSSEETAKGRVVEVLRGRRKGRVAEVLRSQKIEKLHSRAPSKRRLEKQPG